MNGSLAGVKPYGIMSGRVTVGDIPPKYAEITRPLVREIAVMSAKIVKRLCVASVALAAAGGTLLAGQALALFVAVRLLGSVVEQVLG